VRDTTVPGNLVQRWSRPSCSSIRGFHFAGRNLGLEREAACDGTGRFEKPATPGEYAAFLATLATAYLPDARASCDASALGSPTSCRAHRAARRSAPRGLTVNYYVIGGTVMIFALLTLALEAFSPALAFAPAQSVSTARLTGLAVVPAACANPNVEALVTKPAQPQMPHGLKAGGSAIVAVTIAPNGSVTRASVWESSGNARSIGPFSTRPGTANIRQNS